MSFNKHIESDVSKVFINEFAELRKICINGSFYNIPLIIEDCYESQYKNNKNITSIAKEEISVFISFEKLKFIPSKKHSFFIDDEEYKILSVRNNKGMIEIKLERFFE